MFESLDDQIKHDVQEQSTSQQRMLKWLIVAVVSILFFGGLDFGLRYIQ
jgi:hypothetical protein